jgi:uncharacterized protein (TIGR00251 family)
MTCSAGRRSCFRCPARSRTASVSTIGANLEIRVQPRSARNEIADERASRLLVRVSAPPVDGKANAAVCKLIAKALGVSKGSVSVVRGEGARDKVVRVDGLGETEARKRLGLS